MTAVKRLLVAGLLAGVAACGGRPPAAPSGDPAGRPLTLDQWKALPVAGKYDIDTLERLKAGEPKLMDQRAWDRFTREVLVPARKKDQPAGPK